VIELLGTVDVGARVLKEALDLLAQDWFVHGVPSCSGASAGPPMLSADRAQGVLPGPSPLSSALGKLTPSREGTPS
jgi:hypothetical protein